AERQRSEHVPSAAVGGRQHRVVAGGREGQSHVGALDPLARVAVDHAPSQGAGVGVVGGRGEVGGRVVVGVAGEAGEVAHAAHGEDVPQVVEVHAGVVG